MESVFIVCAVVGGGLFVIRIVMMLAGFGHHDMPDAGGGDLPHDVQGDTHGDDSDLSFKFISIQGITAFFMMFGLVGLAMLRETSSPRSVAVVVALGAGLVTVWILAKIFTSMLKLQSSGTLDLNNARGKEAKIYLTIPAGGTGKVSMTIQNRLMEFDAVAKDGKEIPTGEQVKVEDITGGNVLVVARK